MVGPGEKYDAHNMFLKCLRNTESRPQKSAKEGTIDKNFTNQLAFPVFS